MERRRLEQPTAHLTNNYLGELIRIFKKPKLIKIKQNV